MKSKLNEERRNAEPDTADLESAREVQAEIVGTYTKPIAPPQKKARVP